MHQTRQILHEYTKSFVNDTRFIDRLLEHRMILSFVVVKQLKVSFVLCLFTFFHAGANSRIKQNKDFTWP